MHTVCAFLLHDPLAGCLFDRWCPVTTSQSNTSIYTHAVYNRVRHSAVRVYTCWFGKVKARATVLCGACEL